MKFISLFMVALFVVCGVANGQTRIPPQRHVNVNVQFYGYPNNTRSFGVQGPGCNYRQYQATRMYSSAYIYTPYYYVPAYQYVPVTTWRSCR